jgi:outer membrane receptor protein involved in Fe transport
MAVAATIAFAALLIPVFCASPAAAEIEPLDEVVVTGTREEEPLVETPVSIGVVKGETLRLDRPTHPSQMMSQVPGAAVAVTNGEGHTTAIRQPFTTSPVYLFLEDGIPIRSTGFFNHNALYETNIPQAGGVEVIRGPGTALYGSDAIGGVVNVLTREPPAEAESGLSGEYGRFGWGRLLADSGGLSGRNGWRAGLNLTHTDGWREATDYDRQSGTLRWDYALDANATLKSVLAFSNIEQQTGANSALTEDDYHNNPTDNYLPVAYRNVQAFRLSSVYERESGNDLFSVTPYLRHDSMELLASFSLNSDPNVFTDENQSFGLLAKWRRDFPNALRARLIVGADIDVSPGDRVEDALFAEVTGAAPARRFNSVERAGRIYDYDVTFFGLAPYLHGEISPTERWRLTAGVRYDYLRFDFDNHLSPGTVTIAPASAPDNFPIVARIYGQADDTAIDFRHLSPKFGTTYAFAPNLHGYLSYTRGFRAPSQSQLFRPSQSGSIEQALENMRSSLNLQPIKAEQAEVGLRGLAWNVSYDVVVYELRKKDDIVSQRDPVTTLTQSVNAGETRHRGIELGAGLPIVAGFRLDVAASYARHTYEDWVTSNATFSGKDIESAPRQISNARLTWQLAEDRPRVQIEWVNLGWYWLDAANTQKYPGHDLINLRTHWPIAGTWALFANVNNLTDRRYADSASLSNNQPVLSPGLPRAIYAGIEAHW